MVFGEPRICVAGVGAVGGLLAAMLGTVYGNSLTLIARGARRDALQRNGVILHSQFYGEVASHPAMVTEGAEGIGIQDYIFVCVKNYSLDQMAQVLRPAVGENTVIVPVMNGAEAGDRLRTLFPEAVVCDAVIYTISASNSDFSTTQTGTYTHLFVGSKTAGRAADGAKAVWTLLAPTGFDCRLTEKIESEIWQKFIHNCAYNTITARHLATTAQIRADEALRQDLRALLSEGYRVGIAEGIALPENFVAGKYHFVTEIQPPQATSSMRRDAEAQRPIEIDAFTGAILRKAAKHGIPVPVTERYHRELLEMTVSQLA